MRRIVPASGAELWVKLEYRNPTGSMKDRIGLSMIEGAERDGLIERALPGHDLNSTEPWIQSAITGFVPLCLSPQTKTAGQKVTTAAAVAKPSLVRCLSCAPDSVAATPPVQHHSLAGAATAN